jgi:hypothetical protein
MAINYAGIIFVPYGEWTNNATELIIGLDEIIGLSYNQFFEMIVELS